MQIADVTQARQVLCKVAVSLVLCDWSECLNVTDLCVTRVQLPLRPHSPDSIVNVPFCVQFNVPSGVPVDVLA